MFKKILVALDRSPMNQQVFEEALDFAVKNNAHLMLLHVLSSEEENSPLMPIYSSLNYYPELTRTELYQKEWDEFREEGIKILQYYTNLATTNGVEAEFTQILGSPGRNICDFALTWNADLIVLGRRSRSRLAEFFLGSVSNYVLHHAQCSVLIIEETKDSPTVDSPQAQSTSV